MNLYFRLIIMYIKSKCKKAIPLLSPVTNCHRVLPNDIDIFGHMNNGRYFTITDLDRMGRLFNSGHWREMRKRRIYPILAGESAQFFAPLTLFRKYSITSSITGWDEKYLYVKHLFVSKGKTCALLVVRVRIIGSGKVRVSPAEMLRLVETQDIPDVKMSPEMEIWRNGIKIHPEGL